MHIADYSQDSQLSYTIPFKREGPACIFPRAHALGKIDAWSYSLSFTVVRNPAPQRLQGPPERWAGPVRVP